MTIHSRAFWLYLLALILIGGLLWLGLFGTLYHPSIEFRPDAFIVLDTDAGSVSVQWHRGAWSVWLSAPHGEWRVVPLR